MTATAAAAPDKLTSLGQARGRLPSGTPVSGGVVEHASADVVTVQEDQVVAVHDLALVRRAELAGQVAGGPAEQPRASLGVEVDQPAGDRAARRRRRRSTGSPAANVALDAR